MRQNIQKGAAAMNEIHTELFIREVPIEEYVLECVDVPKFLELCGQCANYGAIWSCPPFDFSAEKLWRSYKTLLLYGKKIVLPKELTEKTFTPKEMKARYQAILTPVKQSILDELFIMERENPGSLALSAGSCEGCKKCARRDNVPCRRSGYMRYSIESLGGDAAKSIERYFGEKLIWAQEGRLPEHFFLLGGLLKP